VFMFYAGLWVGDERAGRGEVGMCPGESKKILS
jgi:hypothetical protein